MAKLTDDMREDIRQKYINGNTKHSLANKYGVSLVTISNLFNTKRKTRKIKNKRKDI